MAMPPSTCCLHTPPPRPTRVPKRGDEKPWKRSGELVAGVAACVVIGLHLPNTPSSISIEAHAESSAMGGRWSERRRCTPWNLNSRETIVPENLPRPAAHRKWESVGYGGSSRDRHPVAPPLTAAKTSSSCFSM